MSIGIELIGLRMSKIGYFIIQRKAIENQKIALFNIEQRLIPNVSFFVQVVASGVVISSIINEVAHNEHKNVS